MKLIFCRQTESAFSAFSVRKKLPSSQTNSRGYNSVITVVDHTLEGNVETDLLTFKFVQNAGTATGSTTNGTITGGGSTIEPLADYINRRIAFYELTPMGWLQTETSGMSEKEKRAQANVSHIFFDEFGNSLLGTIPQGISNRQYVVHIIYRGYSIKQRNVRYSVKQKSGSFSSVLNVNNSGIIKSLPNSLQGNEEENFDEWKEEVFPLGIATDDLTFDITATTIDGGKPVKVVLETQTIKMSPVFHATIDVGLINSNLANSTYSLVNAPNGNGDKVIKETDIAPKGIATIMATFYTSPIIIIEKLFEKRLKKRIPSYKLTGRSFFDDHGLFERIYPTVGVSISSKSFENLFFGLNWEIARGLSVFAGGHWGKVNTFNLPKYIVGETAVTQAQFDFYSNTKWKVDWAYGAKLDIVIITNLFK